MVSKKRRWPRWLGVGTLVMLSGVWAANHWHLSRLEEELNGLAQGKIAEFRPPQKGLPESRGRIGTTVVVSKPYVLFGAPSGKISVYVEHVRPDATPIIEGYEFFYAREPDTTWTATESGRCVSDQCVIDGKRVLDAFGESL